MKTRTRIRSFVVFKITLILLLLASFFVVQGWQDRRSLNLTPPITREELSHFKVYFDGDNWRWSKEIEIDGFGRRLGHTGDWIDFSTTYCTSNAAFRRVVDNIKDQRKEEANVRRLGEVKLIPPLSEILPPTSEELKLKANEALQSSIDCSNVLRNLISELGRENEWLSNRIEQLQNTKEDKLIVNLGNSFSNTVIITNIVDPTNVLMIPCLTNRMERVLPMWHQEREESDIERHERLLQRNRAVEPKEM